MKTWKVAFAGLIIFTLLGIVGVISFISGSMKNGTTWVPGGDPDIEAGYLIREGVLLGKGVTGRHVRFIPREGGYVAGDFAKKARLSNGSVLFCNSSRELACPEEYVFSNSSFEASEYTLTAKEGVRGILWVYHDRGNYWVGFKED